MRLKSCPVQLVVLFVALFSHARAQSSGAGLYKTNCAECHGVSGGADTPAGKALRAPSFLSAEVLKVSDDDLLAITKKGKNVMPPWGGILTDVQLRNVIAYIHTLQKKE